MTYKPTECPGQLSLTALYGGFLSMADCICAFICLLFNIFTLVWLQFIIRPRARTGFGSRSFSVAAPIIWNSLPLDI